MQSLQMTNASMNRGGVNSMQVSVTITKLKQQIANLQNQIAAQQAVYVKQQAAQHGGGGVGGVPGSLGSSNDYLRGGGGIGGGVNGDGIGGPHDTIQLQGQFTNMTMNKV